MNNFDEIKMKIEGEEIVFDRDKELSIRDLSADQTRIAAQMSYWGQLQASAESEKIRADTYYRTWRAVNGKKVLDADPKLAEWKVKMELEAMPDFQKLKNGIAQATYNLVVCRTVFDSFRIKANQLQSRGANMRFEMEATGMTTKETPVEVREVKKKTKESKENGTGEVASIGEGDKKSHMKNVFSKK